MNLTENDVIVKGIIALSSVVLGFILKSVWDYSLKRKYERNEASHKKRMEFLERQLSEFYWPLLFYLKKNQIVFEKLIKSPVHESDDLKRELMTNMSRNYFFPNNEKMMEIIETKYFLAQAPETLNRLINDFIKHQAVFQGIKKTFEQDFDPIKFGEPWPYKINEAIEKHTLELQSQYDLEIGRMKKTSMSSAQY
nr:hypothetical protein [uncultured Carboxylicivirga sp.]